MKKQNKQKFKKYKMEFKQNKKDFNEHYIFSHTCIF